MSIIEDKPITLMTGLPGSGKTALIVKYIKEATDAGRPVFQLGIPELKLPHWPVPPIEEWTELRPDPDHSSLMLPYFTFPENSLIVLSEAQRVYRPRPSGSKIPDHVAAFETVRHTGVTFIFDTQHPDFLDAHIRKLVGQHIHLLDHGLLGRKHYEWPYCGRPEDFKSAPIKKGYSLPSEIFGLYKSSSLHIKRKYTLPPAIVTLALCVLLILGLGFWGYRSYQKKLEPLQLSQQHREEAAQQNQNIPMAPAVLPVTMESILSDRQPRVQSLPESAPIYDALRVAKTMPAVVGCVQTKTRCSCQNQQGLDAGLDDMACRAWITSPPFDPYRDPPAVAQSSEGAAVPPVRKNGQKPDERAPQEGEPPSA